MHAGVIAQLRGHLSAVFAAGVSICASAIAGLPPTTQPARDFDGAPAYKVARVVDGDTIVVQMDGRQKRIGLVGVSIPQTTPALDAARRFVANMLEGERVFIEYEARWPTHEKDSRDWAYVFRAPDGQFLNAELVRQGYARVSSEEFEYTTEFHVFETRAHDARKGIWGTPPPAPAKEDVPAAAVAKVDAKPATDKPDKLEKTAAKPSAAPIAAEDAVYVTRTGKKYHRADCEHVKKSGRPIPLKEAKEKGLTPCQSCNPPP